LLLQRLLLVLAISLLRVRTLLLEVHQQREQGLVHQQPVQMQEGQQHQQMQEEQRQGQALLMVMQVQQLRVKQSLTILIIHLLTSQVMAHMVIINPIPPQLFRMVVMYLIHLKVYIMTDMFIMPYMLTHPVAMVYMVMELVTSMPVHMVIIMGIVHMMLVKIQQTSITKMVLLTIILTETSRV